MARLVDENADLRARYEHVASRLLAAERGASYYMMLQKAIAESPVLQSEWRRFIAIAKLSFEEPVEGLTTSDTIS